MCDTVIQPISKAANSLVARPTEQMFVPPSTCEGFNRFIHPLAALLQPSANKLGRGITGMQGKRTREGRSLDCVGIGQDPHGRKALIYLVNGMLTKTVTIKQR